MSYKCSTCDEIHDGLPHIGAEFPDLYFDVPDDERSDRVYLTSDLCVVDDEHFFIRGVIEILVHGEEHPFGFGVWVSQKKENFQTYVDNFDSAQIGPFFGWMSNSLACYSEDTFCLKTLAHFRGARARPSIEVEESEHPLAIDQRDGITLARAWELVHHFM